MKLQGWYLYNSSFVLRTEKQCFLFDYYPYAGEPETGSLECGRLDLERIRDFRLPLTVFVSHAHYDHFDKSIFLIENKISDVHFVLSDDVPVPHGFSDEQVLTVQAGKEYQWNGLMIRTLLSTDEGVAFLIRTPEGTIYHAGDLNFWDWEGESTAYRRQMEQDYKQQIDCIAGEHIDLAFVPLDGRLEGTYWKGLDYFMRSTNTQYVVPMHFRDQYEVFDWLRQQPEAKNYLNKVEMITHSGQTFCLD
ncbi:MBL fold metallo-hydrolase [Clostridium merdae]|uniref:MBL fold metallo-hydrolase n=1 Tax=Clostridium merdae TaxID=1958780 RepID=UPI000A26E944|nr:MBL fold metallo-hydrolase [Clostridium merdae]